jgi:NADPH2:quinone reductase
MARVARIERTGGPEVIEIVDIDLPPPGAGEVRMRVTAIGVNFIDTYYRSGLYPVAMPNGLGSECAGVVEALGEGVDTRAPMRASGTWRRRRCSSCPARWTTRPPRRCC